MSAFQKLLLPAILFITGLLTGCGGGAGGTTAGIGGTGQIASGTITGFGSIFVNGIEFFDVDTANCVIDNSDNTGNCQANLQLGMVVKVVGTNDGSTGNATQIIYDDDVDGPVSGLVPFVAGDITRTFNVLGTTVLIDSASTSFAGAKGFSTLADNDLVEVSGFFDNNGILNATFVEYQGTLQFGSTTTELKGMVSATTPASGATSPGDTFTVNGITISLVSGTDLSDMGGTVSTGNMVEVSGTLNAAAAIDADRVEPEDDMIGSESDGVSIEGLVTNFISLSDFRVNGQRVNASGATLEPSTLQLGNGIKVEVEGNVNGGILIASDVESRDNDIKVNATVLSKDQSASTVTMQLGNGGSQSLVIQLNNKTQMEDNAGGIPMFSLMDIQPGNFLEIRGFSVTVAMTQQLVASELRRISTSDDLLQGPVDTNGVVAGSSITILGVTFTTDINTSFEDANGDDTDSATFYASVQDGCTVQIQDGDVPGTPPDGIADEMNLEESCI